MKALLRFNGETRELREEPEARDEQTEVHDILLDRLRRIAALRPKDKNLKDEVALARAVAEMSEQIIKQGQYAVALTNLADRAAADVKLPKFLLG
jgi:hypothetical protein